MARLRLKFVNAFRNKGRKDGRVRYYFRRRGSKAIALPGAVGSDEFMQAYGLALATAGTIVPPVGASRTLPGTINALIVSYYTSESWLKLADDSRRTRRPIIERFRNQNGDKRVVTLLPQHIEKMLIAIPRLHARRQWLKAIRHLLQAAIPTMRRDNPTSGMKVKLPPTKGHHTWTDDEIAQYRKHWPLGSQQRLVLEFALETVSRKCEVVEICPQHINIKDGRIKIARAKGSHPVDILMSAELAEAVAAMPKKNDLTPFIVTARNKKRSKFGLGNDFSKWVTEAGLPKHCRMHGLKKGGMRRLAEDGSTTHELMGVSGHRSLSEVERYTADANRKLLADRAMAKKRTRA
jgi:integrase